MILADDFGWANAVSCPPLLRFSAAPHPTPAGRAGIGHRVTPRSKPPYSTASSRRASSWTEPTSTAAARPPGAPSSPVSATVAGGRVVSSGGRVVTTAAGGAERRVCTWCRAAADPRQLRQLPGQRLQPEGPCLRLPGHPSQHHRRRRAPPPRRLRHPPGAKPTLDLRVSVLRFGVQFLPLRLGGQVGRRNGDDGPYPDRPRLRHFIRL